MAADDENGDRTDLFDVLLASPLKNNDESSLDIYAGLDNTLTDNSSKLCPPSRNCLDLYEEILTEEGTAKEATYNDLQLEFGKCQRQIKELLKKYKEIQTQNFSLQNENQSLKKNISALIKTARVEINRKDEEINSLHQRLSEFPHFRNNHSRVSPPGSANSRSSDTAKTKDLKFRSPRLDDSPKADHRVKNDSSKDVHHSTLSPNQEKEVKPQCEKRSTSHLPTSAEKRYNGGIWSNQHNQVLEDSSDDDGRRGRKEVKNCEQYNRGADRIRKGLFHNSNGNGEKRNIDVDRRPQGPRDKCSKIESKPENKNSKLKSSPDSDYRSDWINSSWEKEAPKGRSHTRLDSQSDERLERLSERSQNSNRKEPRSYDKDDRKVDPKSKLMVKDHEQWRRFERVPPPHSWNETGRSFHKSFKPHIEDRRGRETEFKRDRNINDYGFQDKRSPPSVSSSRTHKYFDSKEDDTKYHTYSKTERHRTEDKRKREKESHEYRHTRCERKMPVEHLQKTEKEIKKIIIDSKRRNEQNDKNEVSKVEEMSEGRDRKELKKVENGQNETKSNLKLSFMEKLNLTLSPAKKQFLGEEDKIKINNTLKSSDRHASDTSLQAKPVKVPVSMNSDCKEETKSWLLEQNDVILAGSKSKFDISENKIKNANDSLVKSCDLPVSSKESLLQPQMEVLETMNDNAAPVLMDVLHVTVPCSVGLELENVSNDELDPSVVPENNSIKSNPSVEVTDTGENSLKLPTGKHPIISTVSSKIHDDSKSKPSIEAIPVVENNACNVELCLPKQNLERYLQMNMDNRIEVGETNSEYHDDENSVMSIDLNHMRPIPNVISPLNSPVRPAAKILRMESPGRVPVLKNNHKDLVPANIVSSPSKNLSNELNKENQKPVCKPDKCSEINPDTDLSSDELEEGEIVSDSERSKPQRNFENNKNAKPRTSAEAQSTNNSPQIRKSSTTHLDEGTGNKVSVKVHQIKNKKDKLSNDSTKFSKTENKGKTVSTSCLEKIVQIIVEPSSVQEVMQMLKVIRKHVRKNYMKFKIKFSLQQFQRIIESAILNFTSLIKYLNMSKISKSVDTLQQSLCDVIESKLRQVKKNGIVNRLFEQQLPDMKKKLWKFVEEQLDYLFSKLKKILIKFCDSISLGSDSDEGKLDVANKDKSKYSISQRENVNHSNKGSLKVKSQQTEQSVDYRSTLGHQKPEKTHYQDQKIPRPNAVKQSTEKCLNTSIDNTKDSLSKVSSLEQNEFQSTLISTKTTENTIESAETAKNLNKKVEHSFEILTEQQASSLTFNLVSDAQMGEIFKSLLQGSDLLDQSVNCIEKCQWELKTPEKHPLGSQKSELIPGCHIEEVSGVSSPSLKTIVDLNWSSSSFEKTPSLSSRLQLPVHPDVLDESCMFEVSTCVALSKENACNSEKSKSCISSILLEDLAVSLTVPSPLKSDGHLSFLKPETSSSSTPEEVISAHFSEDALLEEEDATEQDIHLALESDNSSSRSSCSSSWTSRPVAPGFQYHPNLPMQAVIMEKSNDHFIVKIRHAVPPSTSGLDQNKTSEQSAISLHEVEKETNGTAEKSISCQNSTIQSVEESENSKRNVNTDNLGSDNQSSIIQTQVPDIYELFKDPSDKADHKSEIVGECFELNQMWEPKVPESIKELPTIVEVPQHVECSVESSYVDLTKPSSVEIENLGKLAADSILNIDHLECPANRLDQDRITREPLQHVAKDIFIDLTEETSNDSKVNESESALPVTSLDEDNSRKEEEHLTNEHLECIVESTYIDLTVDPPSESVLSKDNIRLESALNTDHLECNGVSTNMQKKRKNHSDLNYSTKKQRIETELSSEENKSTESSEDSDAAHQKTSNKKKAMPENKDASSSTFPSPTSLSAKNVIKKKGEVVISWTRDDDREILLECQKRGPSAKTFTFLATKLNKSPNQVSERFQQLMKLFEKLKCR
ncbi:CASP8-associated protein 2 isoform X1 [Phascolarctos cinereus]|uniref:CASP8-associated protein 2 n=1 Tax=Phascolarctos cinereus TaxID=38626 RepID=A0A6P5IIT5_PHACI|nr:CASP8-associated protein 2 isoform X1 [Phascolarctos cinereus]XP_020818727.1 CASP8-associated protein 2 isoform X1 [Phascolarctos cinereus]XP_020818728.1 CASP8-associated protein 2 isoform X2 [Phascolarctos cinereus]